MSEDAAKKRLNKGDRVGKYEVVEHIASGGMGTVYKVRDVELDRIVALKVLPASTAAKPKMLDRFRREARAAARLHHENIVTVYEFGERDGVFLLAMEYVPGVDLQDYIEKRAKLPPEEARQIILQAARALAHAHEQKIVHRDVKPSNFLLTRKDGRLLVKLTDMGLAIQPDEEEYRLTREGTTVGTIDYMAPEQARDSSSADIRSDIYSLGCTFYHILAGTAPFARGTMAERLLQHLQDEAPDVRNLNQDVPPGYVAILQRMLAKSPEERYQSPQELLRDLEDPSRVTLRSSTEPPVARAVPAARKAPPATRSSDPPMPIAAVPDAADDALPMLRPIDPDVPEEEPIIEAPAPSPRPRPPRERPIKPPRPEPTRDLPRREPRSTRVASDSERLPSMRERPAARTSSAGAGVPAWVVLAGGGAALALVGMVAVALVLRSGAASKTGDSLPKGPGIVQAPSVIAVDPNAAAADPDKARVVGNADQMGPVRPDLPILYQPPVPWDAAALRREFYGPLETIPQPPTGAPVLRVSRGSVPGSGWFRSLAEALAAVPEGAAIIEIHDRGPLFIANLPALEHRDIWLRGAAGSRPLLAWEPPRDLKTKTPATLFAMHGGQLVVDGLDIVGKWTSANAAVPTTLFQATGGRLFLRNCTVSLSGAQPSGIVLARLKRGDTDALGLRISGCYARGIDLTALAVDDASADVLIDNSLLAGNAQPLVRVAGRDEDEVTLRIVHSTLVAARNCIRVDRGTVTFTTRLCDSILARNDPSAAEGDLVRLTTGAEPRLRWRAANCVYAGWKLLLASDTKSIDGGDLNSWRAYCAYRDGDRALLETWPNNPPTQLEDLPASVFQTYGTPIAFAATTGQEPVGAVAGRLPPDPVDWLKRTFDRPPLVLAAAPDTGVPGIDTASDGLYHGERLELPARADLGVLLPQLLHGKPLAPRVVFHIAGSGEHPTSPLRVQGVGELVLYFEPPRDGGAAPVTLTVNPRGAVVDRQSLIEVERGGLELVGANIRYENSKSAIMPPYLIKVTGGKLLLHDCRLYGPLGKAPPVFRSLLLMQDAAVGPVECRLSDCVLVSGKGILHTSGAPVRLSVRHSVVLSLGDAFVPDRGALDCVFEGNTWALRRALLAPRTGPDGPAPIAVKAAGNYFTDPFGEVPGQSMLLRLPEGFVARGLLAWQGKGNAFDRRLDSFATVDAQPTPGKLLFSDWLALWGRTGEQDALIVEPGAAAKTSLSMDPPQLDRLALPRSVRPEPGSPMPGADLVRLGLLRKKG